MRHIIGILLQNEAGALNRVAGLFSNRGYNIESLAVAPTDDPTLSRITLVTTGSEGVIQQIVAQLHKLIDVVSVDDLTAGEHVERELVLLKLEADPAQQESLRATVLAAGGRWLDAVGQHALVELTGSEAEVTAFVAQMARRARLTEVVRSGTVALARGAGSLRSQF
jgi:acetolactate synthase I/III small subunit